MPGEIITTKEALELLETLIAIATNPDSVDTQKLEEEWPNEKIARCLGVVKDIVAVSGTFIG